MKILGISAFYHDSSVCLIEDENVVFASQEERFSRVKHDKNFPKKSLSFLFDKYLVNGLDDIDYFIFFDKPFLKFERLLETYVYYAPLNGFDSFKTSIPVWVKEKLFQKDLLIKEIAKIFNSTKKKISKKLFFSEHHLSHAASAFYPSNFSDAAIITMDGVGEWSTTTIGIGENNKIDILKEINFPHSLGLLYSAFTYFLGFKVNSGEYKVMGLAPYGEPIYKKKILENLVRSKDDGSYYLNQDFFNYSVGLTMTNKKFEKLFEIKRRKQEEEINQVHMDIASSVQSVLEHLVLKIIKYTKKITGKKNLCLAGGVALNCVSNFKLVKEKIFENIWVQPAAGDAGGSLGACYYFYYNILGNSRTVNQQDKMKGSFLGASYSDEEIKKDIDFYKLKYLRLNNQSDFFQTIAKKISEGKSVGWFSGRSEFGPRALGSRSIIADPRPSEMQKKLNLKIKFRESFRPFAPSVLEEYQNEWFSSEIKNYYMLFINDVLNSKLLKNTNKGFQKLENIESKIKSVTHVDLTARVQTVCKKNNPKFYKLINEFYKITGIPIVINTSFNVRGEPIVNSPSDAIQCFLGTNLDFLVLEDYIIDKTEQNDYLIKSNHSISFDKD
tara:strand:- start:3203 stop:5038 length:1836 start_codon:yes stop_codon:yes gene_type:complete